MTKEEREFHKIFWKDFNDKCNNCTKECKQSARVKVMQCPKREKIKEEIIETKSEDIFN